MQYWEHLSKTIDIKKKSLKWELATCHINIFWLIETYDLKNVKESLKIYKILK